MSKWARSGQIGLMLLVVMAIVVSLVLSVASRSLSDVVLSRQEKENSKAFAVAESGVEQALLNLSNSSVQGGTVTANGVTGTYGIVALQSFDLYVKEGEVAELNLAGSPTNVVIQWVKENGEVPTTCTEGSGTAPAAIEVIVAHSNSTVTRSYYNSYGCNLNSTNHFTNALAVSGEYLSSQSFVVVAGDRYMRIRPLYNGATINATVTGTNLASQLYLIQSTAEGGDAQKDIEVKRGLSAGGSIFDYTLFSASTILK